MTTLERAYLILVVVLSLVHVFTDANRHTDLENRVKILEALNEKR